MCSQGRYPRSPLSEWKEPADSPHQAACAGAHFRSGHLAHLLSSVAPSGQPEPRTLETSFSDSPHLLFILQASVDATGIQMQSSPVLQRTVSKWQGTSWSSLFPPRGSATRTEEWSESKCEDLASNTRLLSPLMVILRTLERPDPRCPAKAGRTTSPRTCHVGIPCPLASASFQGTLCGECHPRDGCDITVTRATTLPS